MEIIAEGVRSRAAFSARMLKVIDSGHVPIIRHAAAASPEIDLMDLSSVLR